MQVGNNHEYNRVLRCDRYMLNEGYPFSCSNSSRFPSDRTNDCRCSSPGHPPARKARARPIVRPIARRASRCAPERPPLSRPEVPVVDDAVTAVVRDVRDPRVRRGAAARGRRARRRRWSRGRGSRRHRRGRRHRERRRACRCRGYRHGGGGRAPVAILADRVLDALVEPAVGCECVARVDEHMRCEQ